MKNAYFIIAALFCTVLQAKNVAGVVPGGSPDVSAKHFVQYEPSISRAGMYSAQDDRKAAAEGGASDPAAKAGEAPSEPEAENQEENAPEKRKEITPFLPSEKIPADRGVDFPYDI